MEGPRDRDAAVDGEAVRRHWYAITVIALFIVLASDAWTPLGFAHGTLYTLVVLLAALSGDSRFVVGVAIASAVAVVLGVPLSGPPLPDTPGLFVAANRALSVLAIGIAAGLAVRVLRRIEQLSSAQRALEDSQAVLRHQLLLVETANRVARLGSWSVGLPDLRAVWSDEVCRICGVPSGTSMWMSEMLGYFSAESQAQLWRVFETCLREGTSFDEEARLLGRDGRAMWVRVIGRAVRAADGAVERIEGALQDITLERHEQASAYQSRRWFRELADAMPQIVWTAEPDGEIDYSSTSFYDYTGLDASMGPSGQGWAEAVHPDDVEAARARWHLCVASGEPYLVEFRLRRSDGSYRWHVSRGQPIRDAEGRVLKWYGTTTDVDETKQLERASRQAAQRLEATLESITDGFIALDRDWCFRFVNHRGERYLQMPRERLTGKTFWEVFPDLRGTRVEAALRAAVQEAHPVEIEEFIAFSRRWFELRGYPNEDWLALYLRDVTGRRASEEMIRMQEERFRYVARATADAVWDWDLDTDNIWWSDGMERLFGYPITGAARAGWPWPERIHDEDRERVLLALRQVIDGRASTWQAEYRFLRQDGSVAKVAQRGFVIRGADERALRIVGGMTDITERVVLEEQLRESQRLESMGQLTGGVAHDFNNLLTVILGNAELLSEALSGDGRLGPLSEMIASAAHRGAELTQRLLAFARRQALEPQVVDVNRLLSGMEGLLHRTLGEDIEIEITRGAGLWTALVDPSQLEGALLNLCINARDAMAGGGRLTIETSNVEVGLEYAQQHVDVEPGMYVQVAVSDTGTGIDERDLPRVFEPFFTTKEKGKGTGLGLSMVYGFVKQSKGHVSIYSERGHGTVVKMYLPRGGSLEPALAAGVSGGSEAGAETILLVEDDELVRRYGEEQLGAMGYRVVVAANGAQALEVLEREPAVDLLFTDVVMPGGMSGRELAEEALRRRPGLKVLYTSGYAENAIVHHGRLDPGVMLLGKPYRRAELARKIRMALGADAAGASSRRSTDG